MTHAPDTERGALKRYAEAVSLWRARFDTAEIARRLDLPEATVARWVANFREMARAPAPTLPAVATGGQTDAF